MCCGRLKGNDRSTFQFHSEAGTATLGHARGRKGKPVDKRMSDPLLSVRRKKALTKAVSMLVVVFAKLLGFPTSTAV